MEKITAGANPGQSINSLRMEQHLAILMADLTGYTAMTDVHGGESAAKIVRKYLELVDRALYGSAHLNQTVGDQVVITSHDPTDAAITAIQLNGLALKEEQFLSIHAGIHYGPIFREGNNLFGSTINVASRIMNLANHGQILCSSDFEVNVNKHTGFSFKSFGMHRLKNVMKEIEILELCPTNLSSSNLVDPVCHMLVDPSKADYIYTYNRTTYHFCSVKCRQLFIDNPSSFVG